MWLHGSTRRSTWLTGSANVIECSVAGAAGGHGRCNHGDTKHGSCSLMTTEAGDIRADRGFLGSKSANVDLGLDFPAKCLSSQLNVYLAGNAC